MSDLESFRQNFRGDIVTPSDADYDQAILRWAINAERKAKIVAFVKDAEDVSLALKYAKANRLPVAIRGGGHSCSGASSSEDGIVIDLSRHLAGVRVNAEEKLGYIGGGAIWETVDKAAIVHGLATVGGTVNHTGVGGLILGGGYGWLSGAHGLAIDNLVQATVVTADGSILTASETSNPDIFWGIRGGGSNFGVCTEFVQRLHQQRPTVFAGPIIFSLPAPKDPVNSDKHVDALKKNSDLLRSVITATRKWWAKGPSENEGMIQVYERGPDGEPCIVVFVFYNGSVEEGETAFQFVYDLNPTHNFANELPYEALNGLQSEHLKHGKAHYMKGAVQTMPVVETFQTVLDTVGRPLPKEGHPQLSVVAEFHGLKKVLSVPAGATALRRPPGSNLILLATWENDTPEKTKIARDGIWNLADLFAKSEVNMAGSDKFGYGNYNDMVETSEGVQVDKSQALFGENYPKLQALKKKYDPENMFSKWFSITAA